MNIGNLCSRPAVAVPAAAPLAEVARLMRDEHVGAVIVTEEGGGGPRVAGILTDRDIVRAQLTQTADLSRLSAGATMTPRPLVLTEQESIDGVIAHLRARGVRRAPVVASDDTLVGVISVDDLLAQLARELMAMAGVVARQVCKESR